MSSRKRIDRKKYLEIRAAIKDAESTLHYKSDEVAERTGVGVTTVRLVRRSKSWPNYQKLNAAYTAARQANKQGRPMAGVRPGAELPEERMTIPKGTAVVAVSASDLADFKKRLKALEDWHDSWQRDVEALAERALDEFLAKEDPAEAPTPILPEPAQPQPKTKRFGIFGGRR